MDKTRRALDLLPRQADSCGGAKLGVAAVVGREAARHWSPGADLARGARLIHMIQYDMKRVKNVDFGCFLRLEKFERNAMQG